MITGTAECNYDGNKQTALVAMYTSLHIYGYRLGADNKRLYAVMIDWAGVKADRIDLAYFLERNTQEKS